MLQGWGTDLGVYDSVASTINEQYRFVQFDFPGFGGSDEPHEAWDVDAYADFFCKFMQALDIKKATLIGHSYGGRVIIKLASRDCLPFVIKMKYLQPRLRLFLKAISQSLPRRLPKRRKSKRQSSLFSDFRGIWTAATATAVKSAERLARQSARVAIFPLIFRMKD